MLTTLAYDFIAQPDLFPFSSSNHTVHVYLEMLPQLNRMLFENETQLHSNGI